ncbi:MAG TPA: hypothetical protein VLT84_07660 [Acidobacteriota bacterium]|nr:hypothetical protein [Acidobacteriota bacterium]
MMGTRTAAFFTRTALAAAVIFVAGCASGPRLYVNSEADLAYYKKVAVLPFRNLTTERFAGERVTRAFLTELVMLERYQLVDMNEFASVLDKIGGMPGSEGIYNPVKVQDAATQVQATGILRGAVTEYTMQRRGAADVPSVAFDVELIDAATSAVVWRVSVARRGKGKVPIFGSGERTYAQVVQDAVRDVVGRIEREAY